MTVRRTGWSRQWFRCRKNFPLIDAIDEDDGRLRVIIGRLYDLAPQITGPNGFVYAVVETRRLIRILFDGVDEGVCDQLL